MRLKCESVCDFDGVSGACNRKLANPKKQLASLFGKTIFIIVMVKLVPFIKMKRGRGNCKGCLFFNRVETVFAKPKEIKTRCIRKEKYFVFGLSIKRF